MSTALPPSGSPAAEQGPGNTDPGQLTAGLWDDNRNFDFFMLYRQHRKKESGDGVLPSTVEEHEAAHDTFGSTPGERTKLDVALVIDTTGSMQDELAYLQSEFLAISGRIEGAYPNADQRWALVLYRDETDAYVTRSFDFDTDQKRFRARLAAQSAAGGGDFPEAPERALADTVKFSWRTEPDVARIAFWVADAPHHARSSAAMRGAVRKAEELGVHIYPIASSGIDEQTELSMRSVAQLTGGRYLFLTNDSGIGNNHKEPTLPCYFVTKLDIAILRVIDIEMTGLYREPAPAEILRTGGDPKDGACSLPSGQLVHAF